jgi:hypothetical protein
MKNKGLASKASKASEGALNASDAFDASPLFLERGPGVTVEDILEIFGGQIVELVGVPLPAGHAEVFEAGRERGFPWLRLRPGHAVGRGEDSWRAWLAGWVSPADLVAAHRALARGEGIA